MIKRKIEVKTESCSEVLRFDYSFATERVIYSISDIWGSVYLRGKLERNSPNSLNINSLTKGLYTFCIIDGDNVSEAKFRKH